ncbi:MAG: T9SS type A sorting domain-containing protein [Bacteroidales bacterium]|nr:T9SS type A sorting domain-containing protein [Bacteroidales bacterium]
MRKIKIIIPLFIAISIIPVLAFSQFAPPAGQEGTTAMYKDSAAFIGWATTCEVKRGAMDISSPENGNASYGNPSTGTGQADNNVVSLGDGGIATLSFDIPIANGPGYDFAVFENGFIDTFLELAFVEVSSDSVNYFRFNAVSMTQTNVQVETFGEIDATKLKNFAGKYKLYYGTPFDLNELKNIKGLNIDSITHIRIIDVIGCIQDEFATYDSQGNKVNDPWNTPFISGGFDLDAIGVINTYYKKIDYELYIYPNPANCFINVYIDKDVKNPELYIYDINGKIINTISYPDFFLNQTKKIPVDHLKKGMYLLHLKTNNKKFIQKFITF